MAKKRKGILDYFKINDDDDEYDEDDDYIFDEDDDDEDDYVEPVRKRKESKPAPAPAPSRAPSRAPSKPSYTTAPPPRDTKKFKTSTASDKLVAFDGGMDRKRKATSSEVFVIKPQEFDDAQTVVDFLKRGKAIVINMEGLQLEPAQRIIDFIGGACYGIEGDLKAISANIFIAVPNSIEVSGDLREEILTSTSVSPILGE